MALENDRKKREKQLSLIKEEEIDVKINKILFQIE